MDAANNNARVIGWQDDHSTQQQSMAAYPS
jgi:hypothetical protein